MSGVRAMEIKRFLEFVEEKEQSTIEDVCEYIFLLFVNVWCKVVFKDLLLDVELS